MKCTFSRESTKKA